MADPRVPDGRRGAPELRPGCPGHAGHGCHRPRRACEELAPRRAANVDLLATLTESDLERASRHSELGPVTLRQFLNEFWAHDTMHLVQAERALMQGFIPRPGRGAPTSPTTTSRRGHERGEGAVEATPPPISAS